MHRRSQRVSPDYLERLANIADANRLWRLSGVDQMKLADWQRRQLDTGVALRRYATHVRDLRALLLTPGQSMLITPLSDNGVVRMTVPTPEEHLALLRARQR